MKLDREKQIRFLCYKESLENYGKDDLLGAFIIAMKSLNITKDYINEIVKDWKVEEWK